MSKSPESFAKIKCTEILDSLYTGIEEDIKKVCTVITYRNLENRYNGEKSERQNWIGKIFFKKFVSFEDYVKRAYKLYREDSWLSFWWCISDTTDYSGFIYKMRKMAKYSEEHVFLGDDDLITFDHVKFKASCIKKQEFINDYEKYKQFYTMWHCK